jgi:hypothetical protein
MIHNRFMYDSSVGIATDWTFGARFLVGARLFFFVIRSRPALGSTQPSIQWVSPEVMRPNHEADHLTSSRRSVMVEL